MRTNADDRDPCRPLHLADAAADDAPLSQRTQEVSSTDIYQLLQVLIYIIN